MGESPAVYAHADQVAATAERIRREHPQALAWATTQVEQLSAALNDPTSARGYTAVWPVVAAHQHLTGGLLAEVADRDAVADEVLTAALYLASGIDWTAWSINVRRLDTGAWRVSWTDGSYLCDVPVDSPDAGTAVSA